MQSHAPAVVPTHSSVAELDRLGDQIADSVLHTVHPASRSAWSALW